jgi:hypothetical protein
MTQGLTAEDAARFARITVGHATREYPSRLDHVLLSDADLRSPRSLHPAFYGSFDWHSCVEGYWMLARLLRRFSAFAERERVVALLNAQLTPENLAGEVAYAREPAHAGFERPYGWAWLLMLAAELARPNFAEAARWSRALEPLARVFVERFLTFLPKATYPVRAGTHVNTAFALALVHEYAHACSWSDLAAAVARVSREWYRDDANAQAWEPSGNDFLSPVLCEAVCMQRVLPPSEFADWFATFLPHLEIGEPETLFRPAVPSDRADGQLAHLDGLNLSRAWCWRLLAQTAENEALATRMRSAATVHLNASLPHLADDYMGEHWLAVYAVLALDV